jgi:LacI family transcriptional regulator
MEINTRVTLKTIAQEAGVSITCASNIINGKTREYSEHTIKKIQKIAKDRQYIPNTIARSMKTNSTMTLGLILPDITNPYYPELAKSIEETAYDFGYNIIYINSNDNIKKEKEAFTLLIERMVNGIIYVPSFNTTEISPEIEKCHIPIVMVDRAIEIKGIAGTVSSNDRLGAELATQYLVDHGYRNIFFISGEQQSVKTSDRILGFSDTLVRNNIPFDEGCIAKGDYSVEFGYQATQKFLNSHRCDAVFTASDTLAIGALQALNANNIKVPDTVALIGYDNIYFSKYLSPPLTTVEQPKYEMGIAAVQMLVKIIEKRTVGNTTVIIDPKLVIRGSVR